MTAPSARRGELWLTRLDKVRPVVVMSRDPMGRVLHSVIGAPVTSTVRGLSTEVALNQQDGIRIESVANLDNVQLVARGRLIRRIGRVRLGTMNRLCAALAIATGCDQLG